MNWQLLSRNYEERRMLRKLRKAKIRGKDRKINWRMICSLRGKNHDYRRILRNHRKPTIRRKDRKTEDGTIKRISEKKGRLFSTLVPSKWRYRVPPAGNASR